MNGQEQRTTTSRSNDAPKIKVLVCTANMGNQKPDLESLSAWIPHDGDTKAVVETNQQYPILENMKPKLKTAVRTLIKQARENGHNTSITVSDDTVDDDGSNENDNDSSFQFDDDSKEKFDIIAIGMQEATFETDENSKTLVRKLTNQVTDLKKDADHQKPARTIPNITKYGKSPENKSFVDRTGSTETMQATSERQATETSKRGEEDTQFLHEILQDHLPSYARVVSYQRGQMRLMIFYNEDRISLDVLSVQAQNTGRAGLANKGGIVAECNINNGTRIAFLSAHLEAHEGEAKYKTRCSTIADILRGTESTVPEFNCDASLASHFMFAMGDLNFRTRLPGFELGSQEHIEESHKLTDKKDWKTLNETDELAMALRNKDCLVGFKTLKCHFPPTFKVHRMDGYRYVEKRSPSYTDRILYKGNHLLSEKIVPLAYGPIDKFTTSDHKPIRGAFEIQLNPPMRSRPVLVKEFTSFRFRGRKGTKLRGNTKLGKRDTSNDDEHKENLHFFVSSIESNIIYHKYDNNDHSPSAFVSFVSTPGEIMKKKVSKGEKLKRFLGISQSHDISGGVQMGWPRTKTVPNTCNPRWEDGVHFKVRSHDKTGAPMDLTGAMLHILVFDAKDNSHMIGSCSLNLAFLISLSKTQQAANTKEPLPEKQNLAQAIASRFLHMISKPTSPTSPPSDSETNDQVKHRGPEENPMENGSNNAEQREYVKACWSEEDMKSTEFAASGPSNELRRAYRRSSFFSPSTKMVTTQIPSKMPSPSLNSLNVHSLKIREPLLRNGKEVGTISCTVDVWREDYSNVNHQKESKRRHSIISIRNSYSS